jgi:hypothetical protein
MSYIGNTSTTQAFTPAVDFFNGNGSTTAFTLSRPVASVAQVQAVISNVPQKPGDAFTVNGNTITFTSAPPSGTQNIYVYYTSPITQVIAPGQGTVGTAQIQDNAITTAKIAAGAVIPADLSTGAPAWDASGNMALNGVTPSAWGGVSSGRVFQTGGAAFFGRTDTPDAYVATNLYRDSSNTWRYQTTAGAGYAQFSGNSAYLYAADSGTAGNSASLTQTLQVGKGISLALQGATSQAGTGITFPATQSASSDANTLDDYEEGTFTPVVNMLGTITYTTATGTYTKVGRQVFLSLNLAVSSTDTTQDSNALQISGLPFAPQQYAVSNMLTERAYGKVTPTSQNTFFINIVPGLNYLLVANNTYNATIANASYYDSSRRNMYQGGTMYLNATFSYFV